MRRFIPHSKKPSAAAVALTLAACALVAGPLTIGAVAAGASPSAAKSTEIVGPDVADYQHPGGAAIHWNRVRKAGASFAIIKATEGSTYTNPYFAGDYAGSAKAGLVHGAYAFARPATPIESTARAQAKLLATEVGNVGTTSTLPPALDFEVTGGLSRVKLIRWGQDFLLDVRSMTGRTPMLYTYPSFWTDTLGDPTAFERYPIWMANYSSQPAGATLWQFTSTAAISGIQGGVDESRYLGTKAWPWSTISDGTVATPWDASGPGQVVSLTATLASSKSATLTWLPGDAGTSHITGYTVTASPGDIVDRVNSGATSATVTGLTPGTTYHFSVTADNKVGAGDVTPAPEALTPLIATTLTAATPTVVTPGEPDEINATLSRSNGRAVAGQTVSLEKLSSSTGAWQVVQSAATTDAGAVSFTAYPRVNRQYQLAYAGQSPFAATSTIVTAAVQPVVTAVFSPAAVDVGEPATLTVTVKPTSSDVLLTREVRIDGDWKAVGSKTASDGSVAFTVRRQSAGTVVMRVKAAAADGRDAAKSPKVKLQVNAG